MNSQQLENEPDRPFTRLWALDGNNSLKRMATLEGRQSDTRLFTSSEYFLPRSYVNRFQTEVSSRKLPLIVADKDYNDNSQVDHFSAEGGDPTDGETQEGLSDCARNWKAAAADGNKKMWAIFEETGIFASACRHGLILWVADMVRSGEL